MKRLLDIFFSFIGLLLLLPLFALVAILIKMDSKGPIFFRQVRIGRNFYPFKIYKFRTMILDAEKKGLSLTVGGDKRITKIGKIMRETKIDELPQLINILKGNMSFVGSRPEIKKYVELFRSDYEKILKMRPGITDPATIKFSDEESISSSSSEWEEDYINILMPKKIKLSSDYIDNNNIYIDLKLILRTILIILRVDKRRGKEKDIKITT